MVWGNLSEGCNYRKNPQFISMLESAQWEDEAIGDLVDIAVGRVWWAAFDERERCQEDMERDRARLRHVLHWAAHVAQTVWEILGCLQCQTADSLMDDARWWVPLGNLYRQCSVMLFTEDELGGLLLTANWRRLIRHARLSFLKRSDLRLVFTHARIAIGETSDDHECYDEKTPLENLQSIATRIRAYADLYLEFLEQLMSKRRASRSEISDCFIALCGLALDMSADAMRLLWPV